MIQPILIDAAHPRQKKCAKCKQPKLLTDFGTHRQSRDGKSSWCKDCKRNYMRGRKRRSARRKPVAYAVRYPERKKARYAIKNAVRSGKIKPIKECFCVDCGKPAKAYDHYQGYDFPLVVEPVCYECHGHRSRNRGEHRKMEGRLFDVLLQEQPVKTCRQCGCSDKDACIHPLHGNCWWVESDLCSHCQNWPGESIRYSLL